MFRKKRTDDPLKRYGRKRSDIVAVIIFDIKCLLAICIGVFAFVPMLISTIKKMPEEKIKCDERVNYLKEKKESLLLRADGLKEEYSSKYLPTFEKYHEIHRESYDLLMQTCKLQIKLINIQLRTDKTWVSFFDSVISIHRLNKVYDNLDIICRKFNQYYAEASKQDYFLEDDELFCDWVNKVNFYVEDAVEEIEKSAWIGETLDDMTRYSFMRNVGLLVVAFLTFPLWKDIL